MSVTANSLLESSSEMKIFQEDDVHHVQKVRIKRFSAQEAKMSVKDNSWLESGEKNNFS